MPIPKPNEDESREDFLQRCMGNDVMNEEFPDSEQRYAVCNTAWRNKSAKSSFESKNLQFEVKALDEETGIFEGYAATFSDTPDFYGDIIERGAFTKTLQEGSKRIKILWQHQQDEPIGKPIELKEDEHGLHVKGKLSLGVQRAREILSLMKDGVITELSIGYKAVKDPMVDGIRHLKEVMLFDISPVTFAANKEAEIMAVKALQKGAATTPGGAGEVTPEDEAALEQIYQELLNESDIREAERHLEGVLSQLKGVN